MGLLDWIRRQFGGTPEPDVDPAEAFFGGELEPSLEPAPAPEPEPEPEPEPVKKTRRKKEKKPSRKERRAAAGLPAEEKPKPPRKKKKKRKHLHQGKLNEAPKAAPERRAAPPPPPAPEPEPAPAPEPTPEPQPEPVVVAASPEPAPERPRPREDTRAWIVVPKLEALLEEARAVVGAEEPTRKRLVSARSHLEREWRRLAPVPEGHAEQLGAGYDEVHGALSAKIDAIPDPRALEEARNLAAREALIAEAEGLSALTDIKAAIDKARQLQKQWRQAGRVSKEDKDRLEASFRAAMDAVYARREADRAARLKRLEALVTQAELLVNSNDPVRAGEAMKGLQGRWKAVGGVWGEEADALWKRFRAAADQIFEKRRTVQAEKQATNQKAKEALIASTLEQAAAGVSDPEETRRQLMRKWRRIGHVPREHSDALWTAFQDALSRLDEQPVAVHESLSAPSEALRFQPFAGLAGAVSSEE